MAALNENSREAIQAQKKVKKEKEKKQIQKPAKRFSVRIIPIWLRILLVALLLVLSVAAGAAMGYGVLGGGKASDIFQKSTWTHVIDLVEKK